MKAGNYKTNEDIKCILDSASDIGIHGKSWVCNTCHNRLKTGKVPAQSWANGLKLDVIPPDLADLRPLELRLISQRIPFMKLVGLPKGRQKAIHGSAVNVPSKLQSVISLLPRLPDTAEIVPLKLKRKLCYKGHYMHEYIRPKKVMEALTWLKGNNELYHNINICQDWEHQWQDDDPDLWEALVQACHEMEIVNSLPASPARAPSSLPSTEKDFSILCDLAKRHNLKVVDMPADGSCFFHAVAFSLSTGGIQVITGSNIRAQLIEHLNNPEFKNQYHLDFLQLHNNPSTLNSLSQQQKDAFELYIDNLKNDAWADHLVVQSVADMLNINIQIINTITPDWIHKIQPQNQRSDITIIIGLIGEFHYVAFQNAEGEFIQEAETNEKGLMLEDEEDKIAFEKTSEMRGITFDTLLQGEQIIDGNNTFSLAPGENQKPCPFLTDEKFEELANPSKYPFGNGGLSQNRLIRITPRKYFNSRILNKDGRFAKDIDYLLTAQYSVEAKQLSDDIQISLRQTRGQTFQSRKINAGLMKVSDNVQAMLRTDAAFKFMKNIRGSPAYWDTVLLDLLAMVRQLGIPTWFLTLSAADMQWPEVIQSIAYQYGKQLTADDIKNMSWVEKCSWIRRNPVTAARQFQHRLNTFFKEFIGGKGHPIGELSDFKIRIEFQARGSPHAHTILWIKNAPKLNVNSDEEIVAFIDQHQTCVIPGEEDSDLRQLVLSLQKHGHSESCRRGKSCRYQFPHYPSAKTVIARAPDTGKPFVAESQIKAKSEIFNKVRNIMEDKDISEDISLASLLEKAKVDPQLYQECLTLMKRGKKVVLQRQPSERWINQYNPKILKTWRANMDLQFIMDPYSCIMYITSYMMKSEKAMSELLKNVAEENRGEDLKSKLRTIGSSFLNNREVSAQEATFRLLSMPLTKSSRSVVFVNTAPKDKRVSMLKPRKILQEMDDDDENIFCTSPLDRYASRPDELENMSWAEFSATYTLFSKDGSEEEVDHIPDVLDGSDDNDFGGNQSAVTSNELPKIITLCNGLGRMKKRKRHCIIRFHKEKKDGEEKYRNLLMLYYPWRNETIDLKGKFPSFKEHYENIKDIVHANEAKFSFNVEELDRAYDDLHRMGPPEDAWDVVAPNVEFQQAEQEAEGIVQERELPEEDQHHNVDMNPQSTSNHSELHARFTTELNKTLMSPPEYRAMMRSLNSKQMDVIRFHRKWCKDAIIALKNNKPMPQYTVFLSGPGGVGKSHEIKLIRYETMKLLKPLSGHFEPDELPVLLTAFTGTAAFGIEGMTLHSALGLSCGSNEYRKLSCEKLNTLRSRLGKLKLLIIDEVSMVGADLLKQIHLRLEEICGNSVLNSRFGGVSILAVGDLFQLQPVGQSHIFKDGFNRLVSFKPWVENFKLMELTESMRQKEDQQFAQVLMRVRTASCTQDDITLLKSRIVKKTDTNYPTQALHVFTTNNDVDTYNAEHLQKLPTQVFDIKANDSKKDVQTNLIDVVFSKKPSETGGLREIVSVAVGARVMVTVNIDVSDGLANGVCGTVIDIIHIGIYVQAVLVKFDSERVGKQAIANSQYKDLHPEAVPIKRQQIQFPTRKGSRSMEGIRSQFPLTLAWACTIHKVQGKTLDKIVVSMEGKKPFMPGQAYVAFSRVKNLNGLFFLGFNATAIRANSDVVKEMKRLRETCVLNNQLNVPLTSNTTLNIGFLNIRCYLEHQEDLKTDQRNLQVDVFCFVETFLKPSQHVNPILPFSKAFRADRPDEVGQKGGVMMVAKEDISPQQLSLTGELEFTAVSVLKSAIKINVITIYRPQSLTSSVFLSKLQHLMESLPRDVQTIVMGDFNINLIESPHHEIITIMKEFGFVQQVKVPTTDYGSLLDHVYVNREVCIQINVIDTYFSDHDTIFISLKL